METKICLPKKRDQIFLQGVATSLKMAIPTNITFLEALDKIVNEYPYRSHLDLDPSTKFYSKKRWMGRNELIRIFKRKSSRTKLYKCGYVNYNNGKKLIGLVLKTGLATLYRSGNSCEILNEKDYFIFSIEGNRISFIGKEKQFKKFFVDYYRSDIFSTDRTVLQQNPIQLCNDLLFVNKKDRDVDVYQLQVNQTKGGKKLRIRLYSDSGELIENFNKNLLSEKLFDDIGLKNIVSISFKKKKEFTILKISRINANQFLLRWKRRNQLSKELSNNFGISDSESVIRTTTSEAELLSDLFRENKLLPYQKIRIYNSILKDKSYSDLIKLDKNSIPSLNLDSLRKKLQPVIKEAGVKVETARVRKKCGLFFPYRKARWANRHKQLLIIKKRNRILQHLLIEHQQMYNIGVKETIKMYFVFVPFLVLDFRKNPVKGYEEENAKDLMISSGIFISDLKNNPDELSRLILNTSRTIIEDKLIDVYFEVACEILDELPGINRYLDSQQKGSLFEALCFCILSKILLTKKVGNAYEPDGRFILDDEKIVYDAKNLSRRRGNALLSSITRKGKIKDVRYINKENPSNYVFIVNDISQEHFQEVKEKIEHKCKNCKVSAITLAAIRNIVDIYKKDYRRISHAKLKNILLSGSLKSVVSESDIQVNEHLTNHTDH